MSLVGPEAWAGALAVTLPLPFSKIPRCKPTYASSRFSCTGLFAGTGAACPPVVVSGLLRSRRPSPRQTAASRGAALPARPQLLPSLLLLIRSRARDHLGTYQPLQRSSAPSGLRGQLPLDGLGTMREP